MAELTLRPVTPETRDDFIALFDRAGWQKQCWCMVWRATAEEGRGTPAALRRTQMLGRIEAGTPVGLLGYDGADPVAWVSIAPKSTYRRLGGPDPEPGESIWSLACMFIRRDHRGRGLAHALIAGAVAEARRRGATAVEAYPVDPDSPTYGYMGRVPAFLRAGFTEIGRVGKRRHVMRRAL
jgi:GNAT superfamily N-acetyltransferase